jgi:hypothetical protein
MSSFSTVVLQNKIFDTNAVKTLIYQRHLILNAAEKCNCMIKLMVIEEISWRETSTAIRWRYWWWWSQNRLLGHEWAEPLTQKPNGTPARKIPLSLGPIGFSPQDSVCVFWLIQNEIPRDDGHTGQHESLEWEGPLFSATWALRDSQ